MCHLLFLFQNTSYEILPYNTRNNFKKIKMIKCNHISWYPVGVGHTNTLGYQTYLQSKVSVLHKSKELQYRLKSTT